ncbi:GtrA family protein [Alphaproteobacteria bacterium KMM 3653]|uniref:GtrA family protein n=1 Tax=Harenicola maris TaxID=2841044 RepID=A0AAP2CMM1_9RHOB|nr:GtrA family protein [Harenicola maris]
MSSPADPCLAHEAPRAPAALRRQLWRYLVTGVINTGLGLFVIIALHKGFGAGLMLSNAAGYGVGLLCSFTLNRSWTFASTGSVLPAAAKYLVLVGIAFGLCISVITGLQGAGLPYLPAQITGTALYSIVVFLGAKHVIFTD